MIIADSPESRRPYPSFEGSVGQALRRPQYQTMLYTPNQHWAGEITILAGERPAVEAAILSYLAA
jgi:hypothetical protein